MLLGRHQQDSDLRIRSAIVVGKLTIRKQKFVKNARRVYPIKGLWSMTHLAKVPTAYTKE